MKKIIIIALMAIMPSLISSAKTSPATLVNHCIFVTYSYTFNGNTTNGSGFYCIEWFWRTGQQPEIGEETKATLDSKDKSFEEGDQITFTKDQVYETELESVRAKFKIPAGKYTVNSKGQVNCKAVVIE
jgi:hypothetical protein